MIDSCTYHLGIYSKLVRGNHPGGPIKQGAEARINGRSAGFPEDLMELCRTRTFFRNDPMVTEIDPRRVPGGVFVYRPIYVGKRHLSAFARIEARSEDGTSRAGRRFTHCAVIFVEHKWDPALIPWAAEMLFTDRHGGRCWGEAVTEEDAVRNEMRPPALQFDGKGWSDPPLLFPKRDESGGFLVRSRFPEVQEDTQPFVCAGVDIAEFLIKNALKVHGRWLSFALGIGANVEGHGQGFFFRYDQRPDDPADPKPVSLRFSDFAPPLVAGDFTDQRGVLKGMVDWAILQPPVPRAVARQNTFGPENLWSSTEQVLPKVAVGAEQNGGSVKPLIFAESAPQVPGPVPSAAGASIGLSVALKMPADTYGAHEHAPAAAEDYSLVSAQAAEAAIPFPTPGYLDTRESSNPSTMTLDDVFNPLALRRIRPAFRNLIGRIQLLDPEGGFLTLHPTPDDARILAAVKDLTMAVIARAALADTEEIKPWLLQQLQHPPLPTLGLMQTVDRSGLLQFLLSGVLSQMGTANVLDWIDRQRAREMNLKVLRMRQGRVDQGYTVYVPAQRQVREFFDWIGALPYAKVPSDHFNAYVEKSCFAAIDKIVNGAAATLRPTIIRPGD